jgi:hypothetical protein
MLAWALATAAPREAAGPLLVAALSLAPIAALSILFPEGGTQPFVASAFYPTLAGVIAIGVAIPPERRTLRIGVLAYGLLLIGAYIVPSAVGGNADRLGALAAGPLAACALLGAPQRWRRRVLLALALPLLYWQANAPVADYLATVSNPGVEASYYTPLLNELDRLGIGYGKTPARIEVVPAAAHWEARFIAPAVMMARGWERQLDRLRNGLFYRSRTPTPVGYRVWLSEQSVSYVALPDAPLDYSGTGEAHLLRSVAVSGAGGYLREAWRSRHWRLFAVRGAQALAEPAARLDAADTQSFTLDVPFRGSYWVHLHFTPYWAIASGHGCVAEAPGGWTSVAAPRAGKLHVVIRFSLSRVGARDARCA